MKIIQKFAHNQKSLFGGLRAEIKSFFCDEGYNYYVIDTFDSTHIVRVATPSEAKMHLKSSSKALIKIYKHNIPLIICLKNLPDKEGIRMDVNLEVNARISDDINLYKRSRYYIGMEGSEFTSNDLSKIIIGEIKTEVGVVLREDTFLRLSDLNSHPIRWWNSNISKWISSDYYYIKNVEKASYYSKDAEMIKESQNDKKQKDIEYIKKKNEKEYLIRSKELEMEYQSQLKDIESRYEKMKHDESIKSQALNDEIERLNLEQKVKIAKLAKELQDIENSSIAEKNLSDEINKRNEEYSRTVNVLNKAIDELSTRLENLDISYKEIKNSEDKEEDLRRMSNEVSEVSTSTLRIIGEDEGNYYISKLFKELAENCNNHMEFENSNVSSRDIGKRSLNTIKLGDSLICSLKSSVDGYLTLINIGTSGNRYLLIPNCNSIGQQNYIRANRVYIIPGTQFEQNPDDFIELGPSGKMEELFAIVTPEPIFHDSLIKKYCNHSVYYPKIENELQSLLESELDGIDKSKICIGYISLYVVEN